MAGDMLISPQLTVRLLRHLTDTNRPATAAKLTDRELDVVRLIARARTNREIGTDLFISPGTVKTHIASIQRKTGARNRVAIAAWAWETGNAE
jgi:DNA-binding NarL/FixJ family response regulator